MITVEEARTVIRENLIEPETGPLPLEAALELVLAEDQPAPRPSPAYTNSAMDGFAVRWKDLQQTPREAPVLLPMQGESRAGVPYRQPLAPGTAVRISTGAMLPEGADTVIPIEDCAVEDDQIRILRAEEKARHVRFAGEEFKEGDLLLKKGTLLLAPQIALLASVGIHRVPVFLPPAVSIIVTGSELVAYNRPAEPHQIHDSNNPMLAAAVRQSGGRLAKRLRVGDDLPETIATLGQAMEQSRIIIFSGGVSVGPHDHVKEAAEAAGFRPLFWKIRQKPGKPFFFAHTRHHLLFGLPGNPVSAYMGYVYYIHPILQTLLGRSFRPATVKGELGNHVKNPGKRTLFLRVHIDRREESPPRISVLSQQGSHMLTSVAAADGFVIIPENSEIRAGEAVTVHLFPGRHFYGNR